MRSLLALPYFSVQNFIERMKIKYKHTRQPLVVSTTIKCVSQNENFVVSFGCQCLFPQLSMTITHFTHEHPERATKSISHVDSFRMIVTWGLYSPHNVHKRIHQNILLTTNRLADKSLFCFCFCVFGVCWVFHLYSMFLFMNFFFCR